MENRIQKAKDFAFLGQGWSFPVRFRPDQGSVELVGGVEDIEQSLIILLKTLPGERATNLAFGCKAQSRIFDPIDGKFAFLAEEAIREAISFYESRITVENIDLIYDDQINGVVKLEIGYIVKYTNARHNLVYPFSVLEATI